MFYQRQVTFFIYKQYYFICVHMCVFDIIGIYLMLMPSSFTYMQIILYLEIKISLA